MLQPKWHMCQSCSNASVELDCIRCLSVTLATPLSHARFEKRFAARFVGRSHCNRCFEKALNFSSARINQRINQWCSQLWLGLTHDSQWNGLSVIRKLLSLKHSDHSAGPVLRLKWRKKSDDSSVQQALRVILVFGQLKFNKIASSSLHTAEGTKICTAEACNYVYVFALSQPLLLWAYPALDPENNACLVSVHPKSLNSNSHAEHLRPKLCANCIFVFL